MDREWTTGFFKEAVTDVRQVTRLGVEGDGQADLVHHGGPDKAINVYPAEHYAKWSEEVGLTPNAGAFGGNFTTTGLTEADMYVGDVLCAGELIVQVSQPRQPCWKLSRRWRIKYLAARVVRTGRTGWYFRVLNAGMIKAGAVLELIKRPAPNWSRAAANEVMHHRKDDVSAALELASRVGLSQSWVGSLTCRAGGGKMNANGRLTGPLDTQLQVRETVPTYSHQA